MIVYSIGLYRVWVWTQAKESLKKNLEMDASIMHAYFDHLFPITANPTLQHQGSMDLSRVEEVSSKIHLIYHRNKNQHGPAAWWRWLSMLRRTLLKLLATTQHEKQAHISKHLHANIIPKCYVYVHN